MNRWKPLQWSDELDADSGVRVIRLSGIVTDSHAAYALIDEVRADLRVRARPLLLDLSHVDHLTSAGVGMIAALYTSASNAGTAIALAGLSTHARSMLRVVHLLPLLRTFDRVEDALRAFAGGAWDAVG